MNTLDGIGAGQWVQIESIESAALDADLCARLSEAGLTSGAWIRRTGAAPFGGALVVQCRGALFALRRQEASCIRIARIAQT